MEKENFSTLNLMIIFVALETRCVMKKYGKMLIAIKDADLNCYSNKGDWHDIANSKDTKKGLFRLPNYIHYFVSINEERMPSEFGVAKKINGYIIANELTELDYKSRNKELNLLTNEIKNMNGF